MMRCWRRINAEELTGLLLMAGFVTGCADKGDTGDSQSPIVAATQPSRWKPLTGTSSVTLVDRPEQEWLESAMAQARSSMGAARQQWLYTTPEDRKRWAVKWAALVRGTGADAAKQVEHVWVMPLHWSLFRIEGVLASTPVRQLACGKSLGELVSFPNEELSDWIHFTNQPAANADPNAPHDGGFTLIALESGPATADKSVTTAPER